MNNAIVTMDFDGPLRDDDLYFDFDLECVDDIVQSGFGRLTSWVEGNPEEEKENEWQEFLHEVGELFEEPPKYTVGEHVRAKWGKYFYNVTIVEGMDMAGRYEVRFDADNTVGTVHQDNIKRRKKPVPPEEDPYYQYPSPLTWMPDNHRVLNKWKMLYRKLRFEKVSTVVATVQECLWNVVENVEHVLRDHSFDVATACVEHILHTVDRECNIRSEVRDSMNLMIANIEWKDENDRQWANARIKLEHEQEDVVFVQVVSPSTILRRPKRSLDKENHPPAKRKIVDAPLLKKTTWV